MQSSHTCALQHLAFSKRMASVGKQLSVVLPVVPGGKIWKIGVGGSLEPVDRRQLLLVGDARHFGDVVVPPVTNRVLMFRFHQIVDLHHGQPIVVLSKQGTWTTCKKVDGIHGVMNMTTPE